MNKKRLLCGLMALLMVAACVLSGCGEKKVETTDGTDNTLTYWVQITAAVSQTLSNLDETPFAQELQKRLGVDIEYIHPPLGQEVEKFNLLIASNDMPDIIYWDWNANYTGGPAKAIKEKRIMPLNEYKDKAPNFFGYLAENEYVDKLSKTDNGDYFGFTAIKGANTLTLSDGMILRNDWLQDLGLEIPETIEDWETVLRAFKNEKGAKAPLSTRSWGLPPFTGSFGFKFGFYQEDGVVKYGGLHPRYKEFVAKMNEWYKEGLIDNDIATLDDITVNSNILTGVSGVTYNSIGSGIGRYINAATIEGYDLIGTPYPVEKKGDPVKYASCGALVGGAAAALTTNCDNIDTAIRVLDYGYSEEGRMFMNFGTEGVSYEMIDGYPTYTDLITKNPDGLALAETLGRYTQASVSAPTIQDQRYMEQYAALPSQKKTLEIWGAHESMDTLYPPISPKEDVLSEYTRLTTDVTTYADEMFMKFVMGVEPVENYDKFVEGLKARGIDRLLEIRQEALDAFNAR